MIAAVLIMLVALNPAAATVSLERDWRTDRPLPVVLGCVVAGAVLLALAATSGPILDALDVNLGTYRLGAGVVVAVAGLRWMVLGAPSGTVEPTTDVRLGGFVAFPTLFTPAAAVIAVSVGAEHGTSTAAIATGLAVVLGGLGVYHRRRIPALLAQSLVRLAGAGAIVAGVIVAVDGIRTL